MITFTDRAREMVHTFLGEDVADPQALRISMGGSAAAPTFDLTLVDAAERREDEREVDGVGFSVFFSEEHASKLEGAVVDYVVRLTESGFEVRTATTESPDTQTGTRNRGAVPTGEIADRVRSVLDTQVNPTIAAHGGMISLVDVEDTDIYVEMSGGCQGCALSRATLRQGVERMLREAVPELTAVHDVTDHSSGENPYL
ncbi:MAG: NifU family protein [Gemmatimonadetes bacterium]|nr:NifU family protein [Gemmatimonadota bacterium]MDA1103706.1 NifU family protein [Gemmatimonadota bacterium]